MFLSRQAACVWLVLAAIAANTASAFSPLHQTPFSSFTKTSSSSQGGGSSLFVSIGLGPDEKQKQEEEEPELVAGVDYEIPNHEEYRLSRRSKLDEDCDAWFGRLLEEDNSDNGQGCLGDLSKEAYNILTTPVELKNEEKVQDRDDPEWTPYVSTKLPWSPLYPAYGLEVFGLPVPRRNAETWRHFDVAGMVAQDYAGATSPDMQQLDDESVVNEYRSKLREAGGWLDDDECLGRLVYVNGRFVPQLSKTSKLATNLDSLDTGASDHRVKTCLARLTDGFTDELAAPVENGDELLASYSKLSGPNHCVGDATSQFAINTQQGTACWAALNTVKTGAVAYIHAPPAAEKEASDHQQHPKPVLIVNAVTQSGGVDDNDETHGTACHPRTLVIAEENSRLSFVQSCVDLDVNDKVVTTRPKLYNGYTQVFVKSGANVTHSYLEESGGIVTGGVELPDDNFAAGADDDNETLLLPRQQESQRPALKDTHLEAIDVHVTGKDGAYEGTVISIGGSGRVRVAHSVTLLQTGAQAVVNGFSLAGGTQRTDMKTNIHHIAQGTNSRQVQKNLIGGRATGSFRGRIRVEQSAQQTDSEQLSRTVLLSDKARAWAVPSLEIIADDVKCAHGATVSDLSEEELFYLRSRGLDRAMARNLLMYAFAGDISNCVDPAMLGSVDSQQGLQKRIIKRLENLVPKGDRAIKGDYQSI